MEKIVAARQTQFFPFISHVCSKACCDPRNETGLMEIGLIARGPPTVPDNLYVCKYGLTHECTSDTCMSLEVCPISGASFGVIVEYGFYDPDDSRTWSKPGAPAPTLTKKAGVDAYAKIESLVDTILYSSQRQRIRSEWINTHKRRVKKEKDLYCADCRAKRVPVNLIRLIMIDSDVSSSGGNLTILERDRDVIARYAGYAMQIYQKAQEFIREKISVEAITLAVLYKMQQGMIVDDVVIMPVERFLIDNLPLMNDLPKLKINKKNYTLGERLIFTMLENARKQGKTYQDLAIHEDLKNEEVLYKLG